MWNSQRLRRSFVPVVATAVALAACGGDESGGSIEDWCTYAAEAEAVDSTMDTFGSGGDIEAGVTQVRAIVDRIDDVAPDEIADDAKTLQEGTLRVLSALEDADFNVLDADFSFMAEDGLEQELDAASENLDEFTQRECGRPFGSADDSSAATGDEPATDDPATDEGGTDGADSGFDPAAGTLRDQLLAQFESIGLTADESACIADNLDFNDPALQSGDTTAMFAVFEMCDIGLDRLAELGGTGG